MMQRRSIYSLLLTSFILVFAFSSVLSQTVTIADQTVLRGQSGDLDITVDSPGPVGGFEMLFEVVTSSGDAFFSSLDVNWDPAFSVLLHRYVDLSGVDYASPDVIRMAALVADDTDGPLAAGATVVAQLSFTANASCGGTVDVNGIDIEVGNTCGNTSCATMAMTQFIDADGLAKTPAALGGQILEIYNADPTIDPIANGYVHWGELFTVTAAANDSDLVYGFEYLEFSVVGPGGMAINSTSGKITWTPTAQQMIDACEYLVDVTVTDSCGASASTSFTVYLENDVPTIVCPTEVNNIIWGYEATGSVVGTDTDMGPAPLTYFVVSFDGPGVIVLDPGLGTWSWQTAEDPAYLGDFELCIGVTDGAAIGCLASTDNADTCCLDIHVISTADIVIEKAHDVYQGYHRMVSITTQDGLMEMGGFDFLIAYDASAIAAIEVNPGQLLEDCGWEYFEYRFGANGNCGNGCPSGLLRVVAIAETNNGLNHPSCFGPPDLDPHQLVEIDFLVTNDRTFECQYVPITFFWGDCGDNAISSVSGDTLYIDRAIYNYDVSVDYLIWDEEDDVMFPESERIPYLGATDECMVNDPGKPLPVRNLDFWNGGIDIICADSIDARGDINLNGLANEIADAVLFSNYFVYGLSAFDPTIIEGQVAASDVNADGLTLSVADLVYLIRIIVGDAQPYSKVAAPVDVKYIDNNGVLTVTNAHLGGAFVIAEGNVVPDLRADGMEMVYNFDGENTRILVWSRDGNDFTGEFLNVNGSVISIEMATRNGQPANAKAVPATFSLSQNYPNPFNPTTTISFSLPTTSDYSLVIYNVTGQVVADFAGTASAGEHTLVWDANDQASGIYFYRLTTDHQSDTKKMVLLK